MAENAWRNRIVGSGSEHPEQLLANPLNFRLHPKEQQDQMTAVLDEVGWVQQIIVNQRTGFVVDGHLRITLAMRRGEQEVPVEYVDLSPEEEALILATFDPITYGATTSQRDLEALLHEVSTSQPALMDLLSEQAKLNNIVPPDVLQGRGGTNAADADVHIPHDELEALRAKLGVETGQLWHLGDHRLLVADSTVPADVDRLLGGAVLDGILCDPPFAVTGSATGAADHSGLSIIAPFFRTWIGIWGKYVAAFAPWYICCDWRTWGMLDEEARRMGLTPKTMIVWDKGDGGLGKVYRNCHELIWFGVKEPPRRVSKRTASGLEVFDDNIWRYTRPNRGKRGHELHMASKPTAMFVRALENSTGAGQLVADPFVGGGTTILACEATGRVCYAMEHQAMYAALAIHNWQEATKQDATRAEEVAA